LINSCSGHYDYNYFDQNPVIGNHPYHRNFFMATGCDGHGAQHAPAIGRALMEIITDDDYKTIDLSRMTFDRILDDEPLTERIVL
jgi:FAD-dependent oxidoreductase domain-containing protein 1